MDFDFLIEGKPQRAKKLYEFWVPFRDDPMLKKHEIQSLWYGDDVVESLHLVKVAHLYADEDEAICYQTAGEQGLYFVAARLKKVPYIVIFDYHQAGSHMHGHLVNMENPYHLDFFYAPNHGMFPPKYFLFQRVALTSIPETMVLFREL